MLIKEVKETLQDVRKIFLWMTLVFILLTLLGGMILSHNKEQAMRSAAKYILQEEGMQFNEEVFQENLKNIKLEPLKKENFKIQGMKDVWEFFSNNSWINLKCIAIGMIPFLFLPIFSMGINALALAGSYFLITRTSLVSLPLVFTMIFPHGIVEYPAIILANSLGILLCLDISKKILGKGSTDLRKRTEGVLLTFVFVVVPLLVIAAFIEAYITPTLIGFML